MHLLIAAAGSGKRMGANCNKLLLEVAGKPILAWTLQAINKAKSIKWIGIIGQPCDKSSILSIAEELSIKVHWINGGNSRQESVKLGLEGLPPNAEYVLIHDGARCLVETDLLNKCAELVSTGVAIIAATPVTDTIKKVSEDGFIANTPNRAELWAAQTPQAFPVADLKEGHKKALNENLNFTDDAALFERLGWPVKVLEAPSSNIKVTTPFDLTVANAVLSNRGEY